MDKELGGGPTEQTIEGGALKVPCSDAYSVEFARKYPGFRFVETVGPGGKLQIELERTPDFRELYPNGPPAQEPVRPPESGA